ncbi:hypothetical protein F2Q69_00056095 [Brassica cretica]|uniref:Uncharacterized protein n=1 Tax=Brassica cretica TaxID=69181 RepID=A0A8S9N4Q0_BRACR|nr:hypothetical protein F2Q69_00056095 [Brassica cretica]
MSSPTTCNGKHIGSKHSLPLNITIAGNPSRSATLIPAVSFLLNYITDCCLHFTRTLRFFFGSNSSLSATRYFKPGRSSIKKVLLTPPSTLKRLAWNEVKSTKRRFLHLNR